MRKIERKEENPSNEQGSCAGAPLQVLYFSRLSLLKKYTINSKDAIFGEKLDKATFKGEQMLYMGKARSQWRRQNVCRKGAQAE